MGARPISENSERKKGTPYRQKSRMDSVFDILVKLGGRVVLPPAPSRLSASPYQKTLQTAQKRRFFRSNPVKIQPKFSQKWTKFGRKRNGYGKKSPQRKPFCTQKNPLPYTI
jgi:hypothetical protein